GEPLPSLYQFQPLLTRNAVQYLRPDVCLCGRLTGAKKIAAIAEAHDAWIVPHNPLSPVTTAACPRAAAGLAHQVDGFLASPEAPGLGLELVEDIERPFPMRPRPIRMRPHLDGSV